MADDTADQPGTPDPDATKQVGRANDDAEPGSTVPGDRSSDTAAADDGAHRPEPTAPTEQWAAAGGGAAYPRAYSDVPDATTTPVFPPGGNPPGTARFPTGQGPADTGSHPLPTQSDTGVVSTAPGRRRRGLIIALSAVGVVLLVVIALVGSELYLRHRVTDCLDKQFGALTGTSTSVSLSSKPVLLQYFSDEIPYVQVDTDDSDTAKMRLHVRADQVNQSDNAIKIGSLSGNGYVPFQRVIDLSKQSGGLTQSNGTSGDTSGLLASTQITSVTGNADAGTIAVSAAVPVAFLSVPVNLTVKPTVSQGKVKFTVEQASALVFGIPTDFAQQFVDSFGDSLFGDLSNEINVQSLKVTDSGVDFAVTGSDVDLSNATMTSGSSSKENCSIF